MSKNSNVKEPLFRVTKNDYVSRPKQWVIRIIAILLSLVVAGIVTMLLTHDNPISIYVTIFKGAFGSKRKIWVTMQNTAVLLIISLALTPAFKMKFWNVGGEGQILAGALGAAAVMITLPGKVPNGILMLLMVVCGILGGCVCGIIPALLKAKWNTNETLSTLMLNYIVTQLVAFFIIKWEVPKGSGTIGIINQNSNIGWFPQIGNKYLLTIIVATLITVFMVVYLKFSKHGYEIAVVGESERTARYVGMKVNKVIIRTMALSGALCGVAGVLLVGGINHTLTTGLAGGQGFTAVMVSWLAKFNPVTMVFTSLLIVFFNRGAGEISTQFGLNQSFGDIITSIILFFIIGCEFFITYKLTFKRSGKKEDK